MRVLHVNTFSAGGGAAIAATRLVRAQRKAGVDALLWSSAGDTGEPWIMRNPNGIYKLAPNYFNYRELLTHRLASAFKPNGLFSTSHVSSFNRSAFERLGPEVVNLHWTNSGFLSISDLSWLLKRYPLVWTLHDSWAFTGGCHVFQDCRGYIGRCGYCPKLGGQSGHDQSRRNWEEKSRLLGNASFPTIVPSRWLAEKFRESSIGRDRAVLVVPNVIETSRFRPLEKVFCRGVLGFVTTKIRFLFNAFNAVRDENKGYRVLAEALNLFEERNPGVAELVILGESESELVRQRLRMPVVFLGRLVDPVSLVLLYNAVDVTLVPSLSETFSLVAAESMACGVPVVAFGIGGLLDVVDSGENGELAEPYSAESFCCCIERIAFSGNDELERRKRSAVEKVEKRFSPTVVASQYLSVYSALER